MIVFLKNNKHNHASKNHFPTVKYYVKGLHFAESKCRGLLIKYLLMFSRIQNISVCFLFPISIFLCSLIREERRLVVLDDIGGIVDSSDLSKLCY